MSLLSTAAPAATILVRLAVGCVFLSEGIQKFLFSDALGVGRFAKIGLPSPAVLAPMVGSFEIVCGILVVLGLFTRAAALPLIVVMLVALSSTKVPILMTEGFWKMAHDRRSRGHQLGVCGLPDREDRSGSRARGRAAAEACTIGGDLPRPGPAGGASRSRLPRPGSGFGGARAPARVLHEVPRRRERPVHDRGHTAAPPV